MIAKKLGLRGIVFVEKNCFFIHILKVYNPRNIYITAKKLKNKERMRNYPIKDPYKLAIIYTNLHIWIFTQLHTTAHTHNFILQNYIHSCISSIAIYYRCNNLPQL